MARAAKVTIKGSRQKYKLPLETAELRRSLKEFFKSKYDNDPKTGIERSIGSFKWGVYIFYDYDNEPIYVGQTMEKISARIGRHLTNQRTDAVAMSVLDPFEVYRIRVYPLPQFQEIHSQHADYNSAKSHLDALEYRIHEESIRDSRFREILNEKNPSKPSIEVQLPRFFEQVVVSEQVSRLRSHDDIRIARRAQVISRLAQTISEREVSIGLRRTLKTQAKRLEWLANKRFEELGGEDLVDEGAEESGDHDNL